MAIATATAKTALAELDAYAETHEMSSADYESQKMDILQTWALSMRIKNPIAVTVNTGTGLGGTTAQGVPE